MTEENEPHIEEEAPILQKINSRIVAYHFGGLSFAPGKNGVNEVIVGDPGIPGVLAVKVTYRGTNKRPSLFTVPANLLILEEEELPIAIVSNHLDITKRD